MRWQVLCLSPWTGGAAARAFRSRYREGSLGKVEGSVIRHKVSGGCAGIGALLAFLILLPAVAHAQATLSGTVRDGSGAVLPGVTVEASSPVMIEKVRTTVTDSSGQYRIVDLRPGAYQVSFTLTGFVTVRRTNIAVSGLAVITIDAQLPVGTRETVTVTGETPLVDTQSTTRQVVLDNEIIQTLPAARGYGPLLNAVPALQGGYQNSQITPVITFFNTYGGRPNEGRVKIDGLNAGSAPNGAGVSGFAYDTSNAAEVQVTLSGLLGESDTGGATVNIVPNSGGNTFSGSGFFSIAGEWSQGSNLNDELRSFGITEDAALVKAWDVNGALGGPIRRDRLWFFANVRSLGQHDDITDRYGNANAGDASRWDYVEDRGVKARSATAVQSWAGRLTAQVAAIDKLSFHVDHQRVCSGSALTPNSGGCREPGSDWVALGSALSSPESTTTYSDNTPQRIIQATWARPQSSQLLFDVGYSRYSSLWGRMNPPGGLIGLTPVTELSARACSTAAPCPGGRTTGTLVPLSFFTYRGLDNFFDNSLRSQSWRATVSYVTGAHNMKFGYQRDSYAEETTDFANDTQLTYLFNDGVPFGFTYRIAPWQTSSRTASHGFFAQDQWTLGRLTVQGALRYDRAWSWFPAEHNGAPVSSRFNAAPITFPRSDGVSAYNDITPRMGVAWDLTGDGRTALKVNLGKYLQAATNQTQYTIGNPALDGRNGRGGPRFQSDGTRGWIDANGNFLPDCDLANQAGQNLPGSPGFNPALDSCGQGNLNFANPLNPLEVNPEVLHGWGVRPYDWHFGVSVQHEVMPRVSVELGYNRRWFGNFFVVDNRNRNPGDYDPWTFPAPAHPDLPDGGGYPITVYDLDPTAFALPASNYYTFETDFGPERSQYWHGFGVNATTRPRNGLTLQGGTVTGRGVMDRCDTQLLIDSPDPRNCKVTENWITSFRGLASYMVPKADVLVSTIVRFQTTATGLLVTGDSNPGSNGASLDAIYAVPNAVAFASLGRLPSGETNPFGATNVNLVNAGEIYPDQIRQVDVRVAKMLRLAGTRANVGIDLYNLFNTSVATAYNQTFSAADAGATWLQPTAVLNARFVRFHLTLSF